MKNRLFKLALSPIITWIAFESEGQNQWPALRPIMIFSPESPDIENRDGNCAEGGLAKTEIPAMSFDGDRFTSPATNLKLPDSEIWPGEIGDGFKSGTESLSLETGASGGVAIFGGRKRHDLALASLSYGYMPGGMAGKDPKAMYVSNKNQKVSFIAVGYRRKTKLTGAHR